ncbi:zinc ribbon domain-containing protein [Pseudomonas sp. ADAK22]|uniref:zinc ribbon domain-containing protein n=1 Tax=Pseudomonas sp. ADAK22 TaxID=2730851 RepID=UPI001F2A5844|nr:zinc ribbon domain-containing protein [Pseudomonas sp. ADAK22]
MEREFRNPANGNTESVGGMSRLAVIVFGAFYLAYKELWGHFFIWLLLVGGFSFLTGGPGLLIVSPVVSLGYAIGISGILTNSYLRKGWIEVSGGSEDVRASDLRDCPLCAETIRKAAVKCEHCGAEIEPARAPKLKNGWVASTACRDEEEQRRTIEAIASTGLPVVPMIGLAVGAGPFETKEEAERALITMRDGPRLFSEIVYRDSVSGKYPPFTEQALKSAFQGWTVRITAHPGDLGRIEGVLEDLAIPVLAVDGNTIITGPFESEKSAKTVSVKLYDNHEIHCHIYWVPRHT